jgi:predicted RNA-binding protein (virulence factor B family)
MEREKFSERLKKSIDELFATINDLDSKKDELKKKSKVKYNEIMASIKKIEAELEQKNRQMELSDDPRWEEAKNQFTKSAHSFRQALEQLVSFLKSPSK